MSRQTIIAATLLGLAVISLRFGAAQEEPNEPAKVKLRDYEKELSETAASRAVDRALLYLQSTQQPDGSWVSALGKNTGVSSTCAMAFLARGHVPGRGRFGKTVERAVAWVLAQAQDGFIAHDISHGPLYSHGISTLMLGEVYGMVDEDRSEFRGLTKTYRAAVGRILRAQGVRKDASSTGGWRYHPNSTDSDISVTGWQLLALRAAQDNALPMPRRNIDDAVAYVKRCALPSGGFGYQPGGVATLARTGTGILSLQICGDFNSEEAFRGGDWLLAHPPEWSGPFFFYAVYYCSHGMYQLGGKYWTTWRRLTEELLLPRQRNDGSWALPSDETFERQAGIAYCTAMAALALSVDFKFLPIYQR